VEWRADGHHRLFRPRRHRRQSNALQLTAGRPEERSARNVLPALRAGTCAWSKKVVDSPQAVDPRQNSHARGLLQRDLEHVLRYFGRYGIEGDAAWLTHDLRRQYTDPTYRP
jgi:hypothetical protein